MSEISGSSKLGDKQGDSGRKRLRVSPEELPEDPKTVPKYRNYLKFLHDRELGATAGVQAKTEFYQIKTSYKEKVLHSNLPVLPGCGSCEVYYINGNDKLLYGVWRTINENDRKEKPTYIVGAMLYDNTDNQRPIVDVFTSTRNIADTSFVTSIYKIRSSPGSGSCFVYSRNYPPQSLLPIIDETSGGYKLLEVRSPVPSYSCTYVPGFRSALLGCDGYIVFISRREGGVLKKLDVPGKVCTLSYHEPSALLLSGLHTGVLLILDGRISNPLDHAYTNKISEEALNDSLFLNGQEVIVTDVEGKLVKVDLRTKGITDMFLGHKHSVNKRPFSVANNLLCATGADNVVRIWHISGGNPIHAHKSTSGHEVRGWIHGDSNKTYLNYFERDTKTVYII